MINSITLEVLARSPDSTELIGDMNVALPKSLLLMFSKAHVSLYPNRVDGISVQKLCPLVVCVHCSFLL